MSSEFLLAILSNLVSEGIVSFITGLVSPEDLTRRAKAKQARSIVQTPSVAGALQKSAAKIARAFHSPNPAITDKFREFLISPEAEACVRHILASHCLDRPDPHLVSALYDEFRLRAVSAIGLGIDNRLIDQVFEALVTAATIAVENAAGLALLPYRNTNSEIASGALQRELGAIASSLRSMRGDTAPVPDILAFERQYRLQARLRHSTIVPPHFDSAVLVPVESIFVRPQLFTHVRGVRADIDLDDLLATISRTVVLGSPGAGKSTLAQFICYELSSTSGTRVLAHRSVTPVMVVLRDYGVERKRASLSIAEYIDTLIPSGYQVRPPKGAIDFLLASGRLLVIFDGLDELVDTAFRREVTLSVEAFSNLYPATPMMVTSREIGYEQAPLDPNVFSTLRLAPLDDPRVTEYVSKWFALDPALDVVQAGTKASTFIRESESISDLRSNSLMLALLCNIYRGENYIPQNRPDVYEKCALMLFERWDQSRGIQVELPFRAHIRPALMFLANWIYSEPTLQAGVQERQLVRQATAYLYPKRFEDEDEAFAAAVRFVEFCRGRAWVFTDSGTMADGERIYQFTHRTFMEYFTAAYIVRAHETTDELYHALRERIAAREWDVVTQLSFQLRNRASDGAADRLLEMLVQDGNDAAYGKHFLLFAIRTLEFIVPSPRAIRSIVTSLVDVSVATPEDVLLEEAFIAMFRVVTENRPVTLDEIGLSLGRAICSPDLKKCRTAISLTLMLGGFLDAPRVKAMRSHALVDDVERLQQMTLRTHKDAVAQIAIRHSLFVGDILTWGVSTCGKLVEACGSHILYEPSAACPPSVRSGEKRPSFAAVPERATYVPEGPGESHLIANLESLADGIRTFSMPRMSRIPFRDERLASNVTAEQWRTLPPMAMFGAFCLYAPLIELGVNSLLFNSLPDTLRRVLLFRREGDRRRNATESVAELGITGENGDFILAWIAGTINFVHPDSGDVARV